MIMEIAMNILFGLFGIVLYTLFTAKDYILNNKFSISKWKMPWAWSISMMVMIAIVISIEPKASEAIKTFIGLDIADERVAYLTLAIGIMGLTKVAEKKKKSNNLN